MNDKSNDDMTAGERLQQRLLKLRGRVVLIYAVVDDHGQPEIVAIQDVGKAEKLSKQQNGPDDVVDLRG